MVVAAVIINIANHHQTLEATMAVTTVTIPAVGKTTIKPRIRTVTTKTVMVVEGVQEVIAAVAIMAGVMDMEVEVAVVEAAEVTIVTIPAEAMVEAKEEVVAIDMAIAEDTMTALVVATTVAVAVVVITKGALVTVVVATMEWLRKRIPYLYLVWILRSPKKKFVNTSGPLV